MTTVSAANSHDYIGRIVQAWKATLAGSLFGRAHSTSLHQVAPGHYRQPGSLVFTFDIAREYSKDGTTSHKSTLQDIQTVSPTLIDGLCEAAKTARGQDGLLNSLMQAYNDHLLISRQESMGVNVQVRVDMSELKHAVETEDYKVKDAKGSTNWIEITTLNEGRENALRKTAYLIQEIVLKDIPSTKGWRMELQDMKTVTDDRIAHLKWVEHRGDKSANATLLVRPGDVPASLSTLQGVNRQLERMKEHGDHETMKDRWMKDIEEHITSQGGSEQTIKLRLVIDQDELE